MTMVHVRVDCTKLEFQVIAIKIFCCYNVIFETELMEVS